MTFPPKVWTEVLRRLKAKLPEFTHEAWIAPLVPGPSDDGRLVVLCPSAFHRDRVRNSFQALIRDALAEELGQTIAVEFDVLEPCDSPRTGVRSDRSRGVATAPDDSAAHQTAAGRHAAKRQTAAGRHAAQPQTTAGPDAADRRATAGRDAAHRQTVPRGEPAKREAAPRTAPTVPRGRPARAITAHASRARSTGSGRPASTSSRGATAGSPAPLAAAVSHATSRLGLKSSGLLGPGQPTTPGRSRLDGVAAAAPRTGEAGAGQRELPYSFDNFVVGPCNSLAREAAFAVAGGQQVALKQLFLAAEPGLGKTHLARAVAVELARRSGRPVRYASAEVFTNEFVSALRAKQTADFKRRYRPGEGLLVLEDVQFLAAKRATQLEFFHSVQHVIEAGGRVLLTGDRMPQDMPELDARVREQLSRGFVARIEAPDALVRRQILRMKAAHGGIGLPDDCLDLLVESAQGNVRELEGVLMQVVTTSTLLKRPIDLELTRRAIAQKVRPASEPSARRLGIDDVLTAVASFFQTSSEQLAARSRRRDVLVPRQLAMYLCHRHTDAPLAEIGRALGRDHPSVRNAIRKIEREILENARLRYQVEALTTRILERAK